MKTKAFISCNIYKIIKQIIKDGRTMKVLGKSSAGGDVIYLTVSRIGVSLIGLATSMLLARFRTLDEYGTYSQIIMVTDLVATILLLGLPNSINYFLAKAETVKEKQQFMSVYVTLSTLMTIVIGVCLLLAMPLIIEYFQNPAISAFAYVFAVYPWASLMLNSLSNTCVVYGKANRLIVFNVVQAISTLCILLGSSLSGLNFREYMMLYMASMLLFALFALGWIGKMVGAMRLSLSKRLIQEIFVFSVPMGLASVVSTLNTELDKLVIGRFFTTEEYSIFANAARELPVTMLATSLTAVLLPMFVRLLKNNKSEIVIKKWGCAINISLLVMSLFIGGFFVFAPDIMSLFYSEKYVTSNGVAVFRIYTLILLFRSTYWGIVLNATGKTKFILISSILTLVMNFVGNVIGYYTLGFIGPAVSSVIVIAIMSFAQLHVTCNVLETTMSHVFPWKDILRILWQMVVFSAVFWVIKYSIIGRQARSISIGVSIGLGILWVLVYVVLNRKKVLEYYRCLNEEDI